jgi:cellulose biosynthesis protein BcsQ
MKDYDLVKIDLTKETPRLSSTDILDILVNDSDSRKEIEKILLKYFEGKLNDSTLLIDLDSLINLVSLLHLTLNGKIDAYINSFGEKELILNENKNVELQLDYKETTLVNVQSFEGFPYVIEFLNKIRFENNIIENEYSISGTHQSFIIFLSKFLEGYRLFFK